MRLLRPLRLASHLPAIALAQARMVGCETARLGETGGLLAMTLLCFYIIQVVVGSGISDSAEHSGEGA